MSGCLMDMLASGARCDGTLAASSPTRPSGLFNSGRKSSAETGNTSADLSLFLLTDLIQCLLFVNITAHCCLFDNLFGDFF